MLAAASMTDTSLPIEVIALLVGGGLATTTHVTKASTRALANVSPEPFTNCALSIGEDMLAFAMIVLACVLPILAMGLIVLCTIVIVCYFPRLWRAALGTSRAAWNRCAALRSSRQDSISRAQ